MLRSAVLRRECFWALGLLWLQASCSSRGGTANLEALIKNSWILQEENLKSKNSRDQVTLDVAYETYLTFSEDALRKDVVCHFRSPINKTLIVNSSAPVEYAGDRIIIVKDASEKQEYKQTLAPVSGKGPNILRSVFCQSQILAKEYRYEIKNEELILIPIEETLKLKKYIQK